MGIEGKCSSISFLYSMVVFTINLLLQFYMPLFLSTLLAPKRVQKAQHRQNQSLSPRLTNFRKQNVPRSSLACRQLFPQKDSAGVCKFSRATARQENFHTLFRAFYCGRCL